MRSFASSSARSAKYHSSSSPDRFRLFKLRKFPTLPDHLTRSATTLKKHHTALQQPSILLVLNAENMSISKLLHHDMNVNGIYECRLQLIEHELTQILKSFKIALKNSLDHNPNAIVAVTL